MRKIALVAALLVLVPLICVAAGDAKPAYHVVRTIPLSDDGGWDYLTVDSASNRLFVSRGDHVAVVDLEKGKAIGAIPKTEGVHGIALAPSLHHGFISNGRTSSVTIFDLASLNVVGEAKTDERPDAIMFDPVTARVFTFNAGGKNTTAIDAASGKVVGSLALGGKPEFAVSDGSGRVYVNIEDTSEIVGFDAKTLAVVKRWKLAGCEEPSGLAIDRKNRRLFSGCANKVLAVSDADAGRVVATVPIGAGVDANRFDASEKLVFSSNGGDGTLTVIRQLAPDKYEVVDNVATERGARTMELDEKNHHLFVVTAKFGPPPAPTPERPRPRPSILPGTFHIIELAP
jgi:outer membrane protein assembly factor BamB